jgi:hypothetical protein
MKAKINWTPIKIESAKSMTVPEGANMEEPAK